MAGADLSEFHPMGGADRDGVSRLESLRAAAQWQAGHARDLNIMEQFPLASYAH